jgi:hypothetical protein
MNATGSQRTEDRGQSLAHSHAEVLRTRERARRAIAHLDVARELEIPAMVVLALTHCEVAVPRFRAALAKRSFDLRNLA